MTNNKVWNSPRYKTFGVPLQKDFQKNGDSIIVRGYFTSDRKDEVGDIITREATERALPKYKQWGNIRYMHQPKPVGKVTRIGVSDGLDWNEVELEVLHPDAVWEVENGLLNALSVGILVRFEDVDFDDEGGLVINDYQLAEISLVDHPANYDASLLRELPVKQGLEMIARNFGIDTLAKEMLTLLEEKEMSKENEILEEEKTIEAEAQVEELVVEEEVVEDVSETEEEEVEKVIEEEVEAETEVEVEIEAEIEKEIVEEAETEVELTLEDLSKQLDALAEAIKELPSMFVEAMKSLEVESEVLQDEQEFDTEDIVVEASLEEEETPGEAVNRKGLVEETSEITEEETVEEETIVVRSLRDALIKYVETTQ